MTRRPIPPKVERYNGLIPFGTEPDIVQVNGRYFTRFFDGAEEVPLQEPGRGEPWDMFDMNRKYGETTAFEVIELRLVEEQKFEWNHMPRVPDELYFGYQQWAPYDPWANYDDGE